MAAARPGAGPGPAPRRCFGVAIAIADPFARELQDWRRRLGDPLADRVPTHVTLLPPTELAGHSLDEVEQHLCSVAETFEPFGIHLHGSGSFRPVSPVAFVCLVEGAPECQKLEAHVRSGPLSRAVDFDYHPHVTVAHDVPDEALDRAERELAGYDARFPVWGFSLYEHGPDAIWRPQRDYVFGRRLPGPPEPA